MNKEQPLEKLVLCALVTLTNIAVLTEWHDEFYPVLHSLYRLVDSASPQIKLQSLKLLINLSCNEDMVPSLLAAQVSVSIKFKNARLYVSPYFSNYSTACKIVLTVLKTFFSSNNLYQSLVS